MKHVNDSSSTLSHACDVSRDKPYRCTWLTQQPWLWTFSEQQCPPWVTQQNWQTTAVVSAKMNGLLSYITCPEGLLSLHPYHKISKNCMRIFKLHGVDYHRTPLGSSASPFLNVTAYRPCMYTHLPTKLVILVKLCCTVLLYFVYFDFSLLVSSSHLS